MSTYEAMRMKNIEENAKFFASLGIFQVPEHLIPLFRRLKSVTYFRESKLTFDVRLGKYESDLFYLNSILEGHVFLEC